MRTQGKVPVSALEERAMGPGAQVAVGAVEPGVQLGVGVLIGLAIFATGAAFAGRAEGAIYAVAALGWAALGVMLLADLLIVPGLTLRGSGSFSAFSLLVAGLQVGAISLALLALVLMLMGVLTGIVWSMRHHRFADLAVLAGALVALLAGAALAAASVFWVPISGGTTRNAVALAGFGLGTLAAALIAFWSVPVVRHAARSRRATASGQSV